MGWPIPKICRQSHDVELHKKTTPLNKSGKGRFTWARVEHWPGSVQRTILRLHKGWFPTSCTWATTLNCKKSDVQTRPGRMGQCLHEEIEEISALLAGSTQVSREVTRQGGLTQLDYCIHVNAYKHLTAKGLPAAVIQPRLKSNLGSCEEGP